jgi:hypothetical protein
MLRGCFRRVEAEEKQLDRRRRNRQSYRSGLGGVEDAGALDTWNVAGVAVAVADVAAALASKRMC